ncbi:pentatricopeptide repeat-containing protein At1g74750-like [Wolffia australiana]
MIRTKQLGALSQCSRTFILNGSRLGSADDECNISGKQTKAKKYLRNQDKSFLISDGTKRTGSPKLTPAIEAALSHSNSIKKANQQHSIRGSENTSGGESVNASYPTAESSETRDEDVKTPNYGGLLQTEGIIASNSCAPASRKSSNRKNPRKISSTSSACQPCNTCQDEKSIRESRPDTASYEPMKGSGRRVIELYQHTLQQLKWGPSVEEILHRIPHKLNPFQANQVLKLLSDHSVALGFFHWLKQQPGFKHDDYTYTTMIGVLGRARQFTAIKDLLEEMGTSGCTPNVVTYNRLIHGYGQAHRIDEAVNVLQQMHEVGCHPDRVTYCTLIDILAKAGYLEEAMHLYKTMQESRLSPDTFTYSVMINCLGKAGHLSLADQLFGEMVRQGCSPNLVTYNIMIALHAKACNHANALGLYRIMRAAGFRPDKVTYCILMEVLGYGGRIEEAEAFFMEMKAELVPDELAYGLLVDMCGKAGFADKAWAWYQAMLAAGLRPNVPTCNSLLSAFLRTNRFSEARDVLMGMVALGLEPSLQTFTLLLSCCLETESHKKHCYEMMGLTGHPAHKFLLSLPEAEPGGNNVKDHAGTFLDLMRGEDRESRRGIVDSMVDFLQKTGLREEAGSVWDAAALRNVYPELVRQKKSSYWAINLHVMSEGTAIVALSRTMAWFRRQSLDSGIGPTRIDIITGWGRRSRVTGASLVRHSVRELLHLFQFPFYSVKGNSGCFVGCGEALVSWLLNSFVERMHLL